MHRWRSRESLLMSVLILATIAVLIVPSLSVSLAGDRGLSITGCKVAGQIVEVKVHNPTRAPISAMVTAVAIVGGAKEQGYSMAQTVPSGQTVTMTIHFSGEVVSITEGPDPIPQ